MVEWCGTKVAKVEKKRLWTRKVRDRGSFRIESKPRVGRQSPPASGAMICDGEGKNDSKAP